MRRRRQLSLDQLAFAFALDPVDIRRASDPPPPAIITVTAFGESKPVMQWAIENNVAAEAIYSRLARGWSPEAAVSRWRVRTFTGRRCDNPPGHPNSHSWDVLEWAEDHHAWYAVESHPDGLEPDQIRELIGGSKTDMHRTIQSAQRKLVVMVELERRIGPDLASYVGEEMRGAPARDYERITRRDDETLRQWATALKSAVEWSTEAGCDSGGNQPADLL